MELDKHSIPSINVQKLPWETTPSIYRSIPSKDKLLKIYTVSETLKDPLILAHVKPQYGSLGQFMANMGPTKDNVATKKKKQQINEEVEEKKVRNGFKGKDPQQILNRQSSSNLQRKVASKVIIENIFEDKFGTSISNFYQQNSKVQLQKKSLLNYLAFQQIINSLGQPPAFRDSTTKKQNQGQESTHHKERKKSSEKGTFISVSPNRKPLQINIIKNKYIGLRKYQIPTQNEEFQTIILESQKNCEGNITNQKSIFIYTHDKLIIQKINILRIPTILYALNYMEIQHLQHIKLSQLRINQDLLCLMIDCFVKFGANIISLTLYAMAIEDTVRLCQKVSELLQKTNLKVLSMNYLDLGVKQFCILCLGVGKSKKIQQLSFKNNNIDGGCLNALQMILKFSNQIKKIDLRNNNLSSNLKIIDKENKLILK